VGRPCPNPLLTYMSIRAEINHRIAEGRLFHLPCLIRSAPTVRTMLVGEEVHAVTVPPWDNTAAGQRFARLRGDLDAFTEGRLISIAEDPYTKPKSAYMARIDPISDEVWDIRSRDPSPAIRVMGAFAETDVFVALESMIFARRWAALARASGGTSSNAAKLNGESSSIPMNLTREKTFVTTYPATSSLSKPRGDERIPVGTLGYFQARNRNRIYELVLQEFLRSGITKAALARRLGKRPEIVSRLLGAPGNWTLDTVSDLLFAIAGGEPEYSVAHPLDGPPRNYGAPEWVTEATPSRIITTATTTSATRYLELIDG
jgi:hypothetical protein